MSAIVSVKEHFKRLFDFRGQEDRASFWPYAGAALAITMAAGLVVFVPAMIHAMRPMLQFAALQPDQTAAASGPGHYSISVRSTHPQFMPAAPMALFLAVTFGLAILLYAAAVVRRLHDRGKSGFWGLMPLPFAVYSSVQMLGVFASAGRIALSDTALFLSILMSNLCYIITLIWLIVLLAGSSKQTPNS